MRLIPDGGEAAHMADKVDIDAYFERVGFAGSIAPTLDTLAQLQALHLAAIPFENLDPLMGVPVRMGLANITHKLVFDRRGGHGIEHNLLFAAVLRELDYEVGVHPAHVLWGEGEQAPEAPDHLVLSVELPQGLYLVDAGFGGRTPPLPLRLRDGQRQQTGFETFAISEALGDWRVVADLGDRVRPLYRFRRDRVDDRLLAEITERISTRGPFTRRLVVSRTHPAERLMLRDGLFIRVVPAEGVPARTEVTVGSVAELRNLLVAPFGITLPNDERLDAALTRVLEPKP